MANLQACWRTNSFKVKDLKLFKKEIKDKRIICEDDFIAEEKSNGEIILGAYEEMPDNHSINNDEDIEDFDFMEFIRKHIEKETKVELIEIGNEKLNCVFAIKTTITKKKISCKQFEIS